MKKILMSLMAIALVVGLVGAGAMAYFSDSETSTGNTFTAGTLNLGLANTAETNPTGSVTNTYVTPTNWAPGQTLAATLYVNNEGNIAASSVTVDFTIVVTESTPASVDPGASTLGGSIIATTVQWNGVDVPALDGLTLDELVALAPYNLGPLAADTEVPLYILWTLDPNADNGVQGDTAGITLAFVASQ